MGIVEDIQLISESVHKTLDLMAFDEKLGKDFEEFIKKYEIQISTQKELTQIMFFYLFESRMHTGISPFNYLKDEKLLEENICEAFADSFTGVFQITKIKQNSLFANSLINEKEYELTTLSKTSNFRGLGQKDYIEARVIKLNDTYFVLDILNVIPSSKCFIALSNGISHLVKSPKKIYWDNEEKFKEFEEISDIMTKSFVKCTGSHCTITSNKLADGLLQHFNFYHHNLLPEDDKLENWLTNDYSLEYVDIEKIKGDSVSDSTFDNFAGGFSSHNADYNVGYWVDDNLGIFIIPNLGTFFEIFKNKNHKIEKWKECIVEFLNLDKIPLSVIEEVFKLNKNALDVFNQAISEKVETKEELIKQYKSDYLSGKRFSPTLVLYNSKLFQDIFDEIDKIENKQNIEEQAKSIGRNEPCPCGSGKKYKHCCGK